MTETLKAPRPNPTPYRFKMGDIFISKLIPAHFGVQTAHRINGKRCFVQHEKTYDLAGDTWRLQLVAQNPARTALFVDLVEMVRSESAGAKFFRMVTRAELNEVRLAHKTVLAASDACKQLGSKLPFADAMLAIAKVPTLARAYRYYLLRRVIEIYNLEGLKNDVAYLDVYKMLVEVAPELALPFAQGRLEEIEKRFQAQTTFIRHANEEIRFD